MKEGICIYYGERTVFIPYEEVATIVWGRGILADNDYSIALYTRSGEIEYICGDNKKVEEEAQRLSAWLHMGRGVFDVHIRQLNSDGG